MNATQRDKVVALLEDVQVTVSELEDATADHETADDRDERADAAERTVQALRELAIHGEAARVLADWLER